MAWLEIPHAAMVLNVAERTIRNWVRSGKLKTRMHEGRREVEIPDEELDSQRVRDEELDEEYVETVAADEDTQRRLEVALLECGRVKGTLASQERIMENLHGNVTELNAKLERAHTRFWYSVATTLVVIIFAVAYNLLQLAWHNKELQNEAKTHSDMLQKKQEELNRTHKQELDAVRTELNAAKDELHTTALAAQNEREQALLTLRNELETAYDKKERELRSENQEAMREKERTITDLREDIDALNKEKQALIDQYREEKDARIQAERSAAEARETATRAESQVRELRKENADLNTRLMELTRKVMLETGKRDNGGD